jgi:uncharacterized protein
MICARNHTQNSTVATYVEEATHFWARLKGLLGRSNLPDGHGLWIRPCNSIHTFFMRFPIDAAFLSPDGHVVRTVETLRPFRCTGIVTQAEGVLELPAGSLRKASVRCGDQIIFEPVTS